MSLILTVAEQRSALAASLGTVVPATVPVHAVPFSDPTPPCLMIGNPSYEVTSRIATVTWPISVIVARTTAEDIAANFDDLIVPILQMLAKGVNMNYVLQAAAPRPATPELPLPLPEYAIFGTTTVPLC